MSAKLVGFRDTLRELKRIPDAMDSAGNQVMHTWADDVEGTAKDLVPVDTGFLEDHITHFVKEDLDFARVGTFHPDAFYAKFIEFGAYDIPAQPFLGPAFNRHKRGVAKAFRRAVRNKFG